MWLLVLSTPLFIILIIIEMIVDRFDRKKQNYRLNDFFANVHCGIGHQILSQFCYALGIGLYIYLYEELRFFTIPTTVFMSVLLFVMIDFLYYWSHRFFYQINFLWVDHSVHHLGEDYNLAAALRLGYYQVFYSFLAYAPLALLGFQSEIFIIALTLSTIYQFTNHTEKIGRLGIIEFFLVTPSHHRVHHGRNPEYIDKNFGGVFIFWDKIFGTFKEENQPVIYGITVPPKSFNPLYMQIHQLKVIKNDFFRVKGFFNRFNVLFNKPGWLPREMGGVRTSQEIPLSDHSRYEIKLSDGQNWYLLVHSMLLIIFSFTFLAKFPEMEMVSKISMSFLIFLGIFSIGIMNSFEVFFLLSKEFS